MRGSRRSVGLGWVLAAAAAISGLAAGAARAQLPHPPPPPTVPETEPAPPAQDDDSLTLSGDLVLVPVAVRRDRGGAVTDMQASEFRVLEDGAVQQVAFFNRDVAPIDVVLLVDGSGSVEYLIDVIQSAALSFIRQLRPDDRFSIVTFADLPVIRLDWSSDVKAATEALRSIEPKGNTALYGSAVAVLYERFDASPVGRRRAVVVLSDGDDTISTVTSRVAARAAQMHDASVYVVSIGRILASRYDEFARTNVIPMAKRMEFRASAERLRRSEERLEYLAAQTGGRVLFPKQLGDLKDAYAEIAGEIRSRYLIGYYPPPDAARGFHAIGVTTPRKGVTLHARQGYFRDGDGEAAPDSNP